MLKNFLAASLAIIIIVFLVLFGVFIGKIYFDTAEDITQDAGQIISRPVISRPPLDMILSPKAD